MIGLSNMGHAGINTHVNNTANATAGDKCYCHITRSVLAIVELMVEPASPTQRRASWYSVFLEIDITASCKKDNELEIEPTITKSQDGTMHVFNSFKTTVCRDMECECDTPLSDDDPNYAGGSISNTTTCIGSKVFTWDRVSIGGRDDLEAMPNWAEILVSTLHPAGLAAMVASRINTEEQHGSDGQDLLDFGPYDLQGHPTCASLKGKNCCAPFDSSPGVVSGGGGGGFGIGLNT